MPPAQTSRHQLVAWLSGALSGDLFRPSLDKLARLGPKKAAKLRRELPDLYDRIIVGPKEIPGHSHGEVSPHLRRGHFRIQPHGPHNSLRKVIFVAPVWVRADKLGPSAR